MAPDPMAMINKLEQHSLPLGMKTKLEIESMPGFNQRGNFRPASFKVQEKEEGAPPPPARETQVSSYSRLYPHLHSSAVVVIHTADVVFVVAVVVAVVFGAVVVYSAVVVKDAIVVFVNDAIAVVVCAAVVVAPSKFDLRVNVLKFKSLFEAQNVCFFYIPGRISPSYTTMSPILVIFCLKVTSMMKIQKYEH